jgi:hypothetical protein
MAALNLHEVLTVERVEPSLELGADRKLSASSHRRCFRTRSASLGDRFLAWRKERPE